MLPALALCFLGNLKANASKMETIFDELFRVQRSKLPAKVGSELAHFTTSIKSNQADPEVPVPIIGRQTMSTCAPKA